MKTVVFLSTLSYLVALIAAQTNCDRKGVLFYELLGCKVKSLDKDDCGASYECPKYTLPPNVCKFKGNEYKNGDLINGTSYCNIDCKCDDPPTIKCDQKKCKFIYKNGCYKEHTPQTCCAGEDVCPPFDGLAKCVYQGTEYTEKDSILSDTCWDCTCLPNFKGVLEEPFCKRVQCDLELRFAKELAAECAPIFSNSGDAVCCPDGFICPPETSDIKIVDTDNEGDKCNFGEFVLNVGGKFTGYNSRLKKNVACECKIPPYVTCNDV